MAYPLGCCEHYAAEKERDEQSRKAADAAARSLLYHLLGALPIKAVEFEVYSNARHRRQQNKQRRY